jgi:hypothetical protein
MLTLTGYGPGRGSKIIRDGTDRIEDRLDSLLEWAFTQAAEAKEEARIESERWDRAVAYLQEKDKPRLEAEFQSRRRRQLEFEARAWRRAEILRAYLATAEKAAQGALGEFREWVAWARVYADSLDPIAQGKAGVSPPYPEPVKYDHLPRIYLEHDDPAEADRILQKEPWRRGY